MKQVVTTSNIKVTRSRKTLMLALYYEYIVNGESKPVRVSSGVQIESPEYFHNGDLVPSYAGGKGKNIARALENAKQRLADVYNNLANTQGIEITPENIKLRYRGDNIAKKRKVGELDDVLHEMLPLLEEGSGNFPKYAKTRVSKYRTLAKKLSEFKKQSRISLRTDKIDHNIHNEFLHWIASKDYAAGTAQNFMKYFRNSLNLCGKFKVPYEVNFNFDSKHLKSVTVDTEGVYSQYFNLTELRAIMNYRCKHDYLENARKLFVCLCLSGCYYNELKGAKLSTVDVEGKKMVVLEGQRGKTKKMFVVYACNPLIEYLTDKSLRWIAESNLRDYIKQFIDDMYKDRLLSEKIERIQKYADGREDRITGTKAEFVTIIWGRYTFSSNATRMSVNEHLVSRAIGHSKKTSGQAKMLQAHYNQLSLYESAQTFAIEYNLGAIKRELWDVAAWYDIGSQKALMSAA